MHSVTKKAHLFLVAFLLVLVGLSSDVFAQGRGRGGDNRGGGRGERSAQPSRQQQPQQQRMERPQQQRQMPQMNRQSRESQRPQRMERQQQQRQMPQFERRQMPQMNRQARESQRPQRMERQQQRQMPQFERRQMPQMNRQASESQRPQRMDRQQQQRQMPQFERRQMPQRIERQQRERNDDSRSVRFERRMPERSRNDSRIAMQQDRRGGRDRTSERRADFVDRRGRDRRDQNLQMRGDFENRHLRNGSDASRSFDRRRNDNDSFGRIDGRAYSNDRGRGWDRERGSDYRTFDRRERQLRRQARFEGRGFSSSGFRDSVYAYNQRRAWRDNIFRSVISVNLGYANGGYYTPPPSYGNYYDVADDPRFYNVGNTYYDPQYNSVYFEPQSYAYRPYDAYYGSYYYDDPYYLGDPYDDYLTYQVVGSGSVGGFVTRVVSNLISYGYEKGYSDGLNARDAGYVEEYYNDPYDYDVDQYETVGYYQPYSVSTYENRRCLSEGYDLGYRDAVYGDATGYVPEYQGTDLVTLWIGASFQIA